MDSYSKAAMERAMKVQEVILRAMAKKITWWQAAEIIGISDRTMRRWRERYEEFGYDGLFDQRRGKPSPETGADGDRGEGAGAVSGAVLRFERAAFSREAEGGTRDRAELHLGEDGAARSRAGDARTKRGAHRKRRPRRPLPGMLLHIDGSEHRWFQDERYYDLIVILDDATSEIYYAQLVEEESTRTVMAALREVIETQGPVLCVVQRPRQPFLAHSEGGRARWTHRLTQVGRALQELGVKMIPAYSPQARGRIGAQLRHLARPVAAGVAAASNPQPGSRVWATRWAGILSGTPTAPCFGNSAWISKCSRN